MFNYFQLNNQRNSIEKEDLFLNTLSGTVDSVQTALKNNISIEAPKTPLVDLEIKPELFSVKFHRHTCSNKQSPKNKSEKKNMQKIFQVHPT